MSDHNDAHTSILVLLFVLLSSFYAGHWVNTQHKERRFLWLSEGGICMIVGGVVGIFVYILMPTLDTFTRFNSDLFLFVLLPPIVFESGYTMRKRHFLRNIGTILLYAVLGTILSGLAFGGLCYGATLLGQQMFGAPAPGMDNFLECLLFGALLAPVDPVATLAIFKSANADPLLYNLMFGESMLNDAVAIVMFRTLDSIIHGGGFEIGETTGTFFWISIGSTIIGAFFGLLSAFLFKHIRLHHSSAEVGVLYLFAITCYMFAEAVGASGIAAIFFCSMIMGHLTWYNLTPLGQVCSKNSFRTIKQVAEFIVFSSIGFILASFYSLDRWPIVFTLCAVVFCFLSRFFVVCPLSVLSNLTRKEEDRVSFSHQFLVSFSGLRGAFSLALAFSLLSHKDHDGNYYHPGRNTILVATCVVIPFTVIVYGGLTAPLLAWLGLKEGELSSQYQALSSSPPTENANKPRPALVLFFKNLDKKFFKRFFTVNPEKSNMKGAQSVRRTASFSDNVIEGELRYIAETNEM